MEVCKQMKTNVNVKVDFQNEEAWNSFEFEGRKKYLKLFNNKKSDTKKLKRCQVFSLMVANNGYVNCTVIKRLKPNNIRIRQ